MQMAQKQGASFYQAHGSAKIVFAHQIRREWQKNSTKNQERCECLRMRIIMPDKWSYLCSATKENAFEQDGLNVAAKCLRNNVEFVFMSVVPEFVHT